MEELKKFLQEFGFSLYQMLQILPMVVGFIDVCLERKITTSARVFVALYIVKRITSKVILLMPISDCRSIRGVPY